MSLGRDGLLARGFFFFFCFVQFRLANLPIAVLTAAMGLAGFLGGVIAPSRDMLVRNSAPPGCCRPRLRHRLHRLQFERHVSPLLFGWIMDQRMPHWVFGAPVVFMVLTVVLALVTDRKPAKTA